MVSVFEPYPELTGTWLDTHQSMLKPVQAYFSDAEKKQPIVVLYELVYNE